MHFPQIALICADKKYKTQFNISVNLRIPREIVCQVGEMTD